MQLAHRDASNQENLINPEMHTSIVIKLISKCADYVSVRKTIKSFSNKKDWRNKEMRVLSKVGNQIFTTLNL